MFKFIIETNIFFFITWIVRLWIMQGIMTAIPMASSTIGSLSYTFLHLVE
jgi:hypothetical protein